MYVLYCWATNILATELQIAAYLNAGGFTWDSVTECREVSSKACAPAPWTDKVLIVFCVVLCAITSTEKIFCELYILHLYDNKVSFILTPLSFVFHSSAGVFVKVVLYLLVIDLNVPTNFYQQPKLIFS